MMAMGRVSIAMLLAVWLLPTSGAAQTASLPPASAPAGASDVFRSGASSYIPRYDRPSAPPQIFTVGGYPTAGPRYVSPNNDSAPNLSRYMDRGMYSGSRGYDLVVPRGSRPYVGRSYVRTMAYDYGAPVWVPTVQTVRFIDYSRSPFLYGVTYVSVSHPHHHHLLHVTHFQPSRTPAMYVIPGCFAGDAPPQRPERLKPGCRLEDLRRIYY